MKTSTLIWGLALGGWLLGVSFVFTPCHEERNQAGGWPDLEAMLPGDHNNWKSGGVFRCENARVSFMSDAPLEVISAKSSKLRGVIDTAKQTFAWSVDVRTFEGFNSPLQREHFNENYMESKKYPKASFSGKLIEKIDFRKNGTYTIRTKGQLNIHGVDQERIIKCLIEVLGNKIKVQSTFTVLLVDHNISIPKVVYQKIAEEIVVSVNAELTEN